MKRLFAGIFPTLIIAILIMGCSGGQSSGIIPGMPDAGSYDSGMPGSDEIRDSGITTDGNAPGLEAGHLLWGYWQIGIDENSGVAEIIPLRGVAMHLNLVPMMQPPVGNLISIEGPIWFHDGLIELDVGLSHPYDEEDTLFTGFDVCGTIISHGSIEASSDSSILIPGPDDLQLLNPDGYTRWFNPVEFPYDAQKPMSGYVDGVLGAPDSFADYTATVNAYKYFADGLAADADISTLDMNGRGHFAAGSKNIRHYILKKGGGALLFNYAVEAHWSFPTQIPPDVPDEFPPGANRSEPWRIETEEVLNTLYNDGLGGSGGFLRMTVTAYDWFNAGQNTMIVDSPSPACFTPQIFLAPDEVYEQSCVFNVEISDCLPPQDELPLIIKVSSEDFDYGGKLSGEPISTYLPASVEVGIEPPDVLHAIVVATTETNIVIGGQVSFDGSNSTAPPEDPIIEYAWEMGDDSDFDDSYEIAPTFQYDEEGVFEVRLKVSNLAGDDTSDPIEVVVGQPLHAVAAALGETNVIVPGSVEFDGSQSTTPPGTVITDYDWEVDGDDDFDDYIGINPNIDFTEVGTFYVKLRVTNDQMDQDISLPVEVVCADPLNAVAEALGPTDIYIGGGVNFSGESSTTPPWAPITDYDWEADGDDDFDDYSGPTPYMTFDAESIYLVKLRVTNSDLDQDLSNSVVVRCGYPLEAKAEALTPTLIQPGETVEFDASSSTGPFWDPIAEYYWESTGDELFDDAVGVNPTIQFDDIGTFQVKVKIVTAGSDEDISDPIEVEVTGELTADAEALTSTNIYVGGSVQFTGSGSFCPPPYSITEYAWDADGDLDFDEAYGENVEIDFPSPGTYDVRLRVTNDEPAEDVSDPVQVNVGEPLEALFTVVGDTNIHAGQSIEFDASPSKTPPWAPITDYDWDIDGDEDFDDDHGVNPHIVFPSPGDYRVKLRVTNSDMDQDVSDVFELTVPATTFYVDDDNVSGPWDGSEANPFRTITDAMDASSDHGTIYVQSGEYTEDLHVQKPLHIEGLGTPPRLITSYNLDDSGFKVSSTGFEGSWKNFSFTPRLAPSPGNVNTMIYLGCDGSLSDYEMDSIRIVMPEDGDPTGQAVLVVDGGTNIDITNCVFNDIESNYSGQVGIPIDLRGCTDLLFECNRFMNWDYGTFDVSSGSIDIKLLRIYNSNNVSLIKNLIGDHLFGNMEPLGDPIILYGIYEEGTSDNILMRNNLIRRLLISTTTETFPTYYGVWVDGVSNFSFHQNTVATFGSPFVGECYGYGIYLSGISTDEMYNNIIAHIFPPFVWGHSYGYYLGSGTLPVIAYSDIFDGIGFNFTRLGGNAVSGAGMLDTNPMFVQNFTDQHLDVGSPCIGSGYGGADMGCYGGSDPLPDW